MSMEQKLKEILDEILNEVEQELEESTTTGDVAGYNTPFAFGANRKKDKKKEKETATQAGYTLAESVNEDKFYNTRVQYTDPKSKKKFVGDVVRKDGDEYTVNLGKDGRFEKYILAKAKDLKIVSKSKKRTYESVNEAKYKVGDTITVIRKDGKKYKGKVEKLNPLKLRTDSTSTVVLPNPTIKKVVKESVNEGKFKPSQVRSAISRVKKQLMRKWKQKGGYENFGQKELRQLQDKFDYNAYGDKDEREISHMLDAFNNWAMNYDGNMREDINEAKVKRPVNRWLELKNDDTMHPHKKMAMGLKELKYQLKEVEKFFNWYNKIKTMNELDSQNYWKRTNNHIYTIKEKLIKIAKTIQEIEK
jgi:hypothetical protein